MSAQLATVAAASAEELKAARLAAATSTGTWPGSDAATDSGQPDGEAQVTDRSPKGPGREKRNASSRAQGAKRQAKRDSR